MIKSRFCSVLSCYLISIHCCFFVKLVLPHYFSCHFICYILLFFRIAIIRDPFELLIRLTKFHDIFMNVMPLAWGGMDWIDLAQDRDQWGALVNTVMNFWVP
jgi:hypothetical protein